MRLITRVAGELRTSACFHKFASCGRRFQTRQSSL